MRLFFFNDIQLPELLNGWYVQDVAVHIFDTPICPYDVVLGREILKGIGLKMDFEK